jgi:hypothetical protein
MIPDSKTQTTTNHRTMSTTTATAEEQEIYVEYVRDRAGEEPFMMGGRKFQFVTVKNSKGRTDIGVYSFAEDLCYDYAFWRNAYGLK